MKKFLIFFMVMFGMACGAMASDYYGTQNDTKSGVDGPCIMKPSYKDANNSYAVYFNTGVDAVSSECVAEFDNIKSELYNLYRAGNIAYFVLVASADQQGDGKGYDNKALSKRRYDYVLKKVLPTDARVEEIGWVAGSSTAKEFEPEYTSNWTYRSVYIYPVLRQTECEPELIDKIKSNMAILDKAFKKYPDSKDLKKLLDDYNKALEICDTPGKKLTPSKSEELYVLLSGALVLIESVNTQYNLGITSSSTEIDTYYSRLSKIRDSLKLNVWRDAEGKFNTARLVSDSVAGVVLGTVGGLVTSHLVKKNQLKKGFEDLNCSVGGQKVAGYGDDFRIGLQ
jgi:hypothetical protein